MNILLPYVKDLADRNRVLVWAGDDPQAQASHGRLFHISAFLSHLNVFSFAVQHSFAYMESVFKENRLHKVVLMLNAHKKCPVVLFFSVVSL